MPDKMIYSTPQLVSDLELLVAAGYAPSHSAAIRKAIAEAVKQLQKESEE